MYNKIKSIISTGLILLSCCMMSSCLDLEPQANMGDNLV